MANRHRIEMNRSRLFADIHDLLLARRANLKQYLSGELANLGTDEDYESLDDEAYVIMATSEANELDLIQAALDRFYHGTYGRCEHCEMEIPGNRLRALPCTDACIDCQRKLEAANGGILMSNRNRAHSDCASPLAS